MNSPLASSKEIVEFANDLHALCELLLCPKCRDESSTITFNEQYLTCSSCSQNYPLFINKRFVLPWVFEEPEQTLFDWKARLNGFEHSNKIEQQHLKHASKDKRLSKAQLNRVKKLLDAKKEQVKQIHSIISPLALQEQTTDANKDADIPFHAKIPKNQGLTSYYDNIFRDWAWDNGENEQLLAALESVLLENSNFGTLLTLGAGAGRLSYDLHIKYKPKHSILLDINPLLLLTASNLLQGEKIPLTEFPIAPINKDSFSNNHICYAEQSIMSNTNLIFANGMNPPFKPNSIDTVLTPWLIDIIPQNLREFIPRINQILKTGGHWLNTGSLAFLHKDPAWNYSENELIELFEKNGFEVIASNRKSIQYLHSPTSANGRVEQVFNFNVKKIKDTVTSPKHEYLPPWIKNTDKPIPLDQQFNFVSSQYLLKAQVIGAIDGSRSVAQIGGLLAKQYNLNVDEATHAVKRILIELVEDLK